MGALMRATRAEVRELVAGDAEWWPCFLGAVAEGGREAIKAERDKRGWSWGALWGWIVEDEGRYREYVQALEAYVQDKALETVGIADESGDGVLRVGTRFKLAEKVDPVRWGKRVQHEHSAVGDLGERLRRARGRELDVTPMAEDAESLQVIEASNQAGRLAAAHVAVAEPVETADTAEDEI